MATTKTKARLLRASYAFAFAAGVLTAACSGTATAETAKLTQISVQRFIASYPDVKSLAVTQATAKGKKIGSSDNALLAVVEAAGDDTIKAELDSTARRHGFRDGKEWFGVARSVGVAYAHMKGGSSTDEVKAQKKLEKAIAKVEDMPLLSDKQKAKLIAKLREGAGALEPPPAENMAVVKAMAPQIEAAVKR
jgi:putative intracellular protease/amidase